MKSSSKARFFCEACGAEVKAGSATCPSCGSLFTAVRCPECGYEGKAPEFRSGCPVCGYRAAPGETFTATPVTGRKEKRALPVAFYRATIIVLSALLLGLLLILVLRL
jgi:uncharacterized membrane protein YvbJ